MLKSRKDEVRPGAEREIAAHGAGAAGRRPSLPTWMRLRRRGTATLVTVLALVVIARAIAPVAIAAAIRTRLKQIPEYEGRLADVDLNLWRGAYALDGVDIRKRGHGVETPFFSARRIDFSIAWRELVRGRIVADIIVDRARLAFVKAESERASQLEADRRWQDAIQDVFPIEITHLVLEHGQIHWLDHTRHPTIDVSMHEVRIVATGLRNRRHTDDEDALPAAIVMEGKTVGEGDVHVTLRLAPLESPPRFDLDVAVENVPLPALNDLLRAYARVDVSRGTFEAYLEVAARDGSFRGYVKPFFRDLSFENVTDRERPLLEKVWESVANFMENLLKNPDRQQLGTRVPFSGDFGGTDVGTFAAVANAVRYGFGAAFSEAVEGTLQPSDVAPAGEGR